MNIHTPLESVKGVGKKTAQQLELAGLTTVGDLVMFLPRKHEDFSEVVKIVDIKPGKATIKARCEAITTRRVRRGLQLTTATLSDDTGKLQATWFNQAYRAVQLKNQSDEFYFSGEFEFQYNRYQLTNPSAEKVSDMPLQTDRLLPVYPAIKGLKSTLVRKLLGELKPFMAMLPETLPQQLVASHKLAAHGEALLGMHFPRTTRDITQARERLAFEELFSLILAAEYNRSDNQKLAGWAIPFEQPVVAQFVKQLPFELTPAQRIAAWDILQDFEKKIPMNRLLQGDVGSGKTVVAGIAARQAASHGYQTAFLAPTEILALQHAETLKALLEPFGVRVGLLTGSVKGAKRTALYQQIADGQLDVTVGTHALLQPTVHFHKLGFVVIDEQHRFGVEQRQKLLEKSANMPHLLSMTATPIPRSLALTVYGELDISTLSDMPKGRKPIITKLWQPTSRTQMYRQMAEQLQAGRQAYVICSLIDEDSSNDAKSVEEEYHRLNRTVFQEYCIEMMHGKLKPEVKARIMQQFGAGEIDILVSTTVVEVGVNVPNATVMMIENADRFGLAQLHQLRGRVGRGTQQGYCFLMLSDTKAPSQRLREIEKSHDGFHLAEVDLRLRGPGEIYGKSQHGALNLQIATLADTKLIAQAQKAARAFVASGQDLVQYKQLQEQVAQYQRLTTLN